jgi:hypothetical protein
MQQYSDYLLIISLPDQVAREVAVHKQAAVNTIGHFEAMQSTPCIIISHQTRCRPFLVNAAIEKMRARLAVMSPAVLQINGFGFFNDGRYSKTIYAVVKPQENSENWLRLMFKEMGVDTRNFVPGIVIAKRIDAASFCKLWPEISRQEISAIFTPVSVTVLHRETFVEFSEWRVYRELFFNGRSLAF